jgi:hypothetical protein
MMKKGFFAAVFAALPVLGLFGASAFSLSAGGGGFAGGLFTRYKLRTSGTLGIPVEVTVDQNVNQFNYGGFFFVDAAWVELSFGLQGGRNNYRELMSAVSGETTVYNRDLEGTGREIMLGIGLLGKYPFRLGGRFTIFPLAGLEYQIALLERRKPDKFKEYDRTDGIREPDRYGRAFALSAWNSLFVMVGGGLDFAFYPRLFLRTEWLCGFRLKTFYEVDGLEQVKTLVQAPNPKLGGLSSNPVLKVSLGWRFF